MNQFFVDLFQSVGLIILAFGGARNTYAIKALSK